MVRDGTHDDLNDVVRMAEKFWAFTRYDDPFDPEHVWCMAAMALDHGLLAMLIEDEKAVGFTAGVAGPLLGNASVLTGTEIAWWVEPEYRRGRNGIALMKHIEEQAKRRGIKYWNMIVMESCQPEVGSAIYERMGYEKSETSYTRVL